MLGTEQGGGMHFSPVLASVELLPFLHMVTNKKPGTPCFFPSHVPNHLLNGPGFHSPQVLSSPPPLSSLFLSEPRGFPQALDW